MPVCDVCSKSMEFEDGFSLTTAQVVLTTWYWERALRHGLAVIHELEPNGGNALLHQIEQQASQHTGWLVCEACSSGFDFDKEQARAYAQQAKDPIDVSAVSPKLAESYAVQAWETLYSQKPELPGFSDVIIRFDPDAGKLTVLNQNDEEISSDIRGHVRKLWRSLKRFLNSSNTSVFTRHYGFIVEENTFDFFVQVSTYAQAFGEEIPGSYVGELLRTYDDLGLHGKRVVDLMHALAKVHNFALGGVLWSVGGNKVRYNVGRIEPGISETDIINVRRLSNPTIPMQLKPYYYVYVNQMSKYYDTV